jgi:hypothetical protein
MESSFLSYSVREQKHQAKLGGGGEGQKLFPATVDRQTER